MRARGFTLVELLIGLAIAAVVLTAGELTVLRAAGSVRRTREREALRRQGQGVVDLLTSELRQAGLGRPTGGRKSNPADRFPAAVLAATTTSVTFLADVPRPESALNGFSRLAGDLATRPADGLPLLNELNGGCDIRTSASSFVACNSAASSLTAPAGSADCAAQPATAPSCPWAQAKYQAGEALIVQDGDGQWEEVTVDSSLFQTTSLGPSYARTTLHLTGGVALTQPNGAWVSTPDRLTYAQVGSTLIRSQCWASVGAPVATQLLAGCGSAGTGSEALAAGVQALALDYLDASGASLRVAGAVPVADLDRVARVTATFTLAAPSGAAETFTASVAVLRGGS
jgi:prepilin-type N-terminal cleavage/methylation domain-containing protein